jgi:hypothetical protein
MSNKIAWCFTVKVILFIHIFLLLMLPSVQAQLSPDPVRGLMAGQPVNPATSTEPGLLFYLSGEKQFSADFAAGGQNQPNYLRGVKVIPDGAFGKAFEASDEQLMSYWAPGNIYAQRGTLSFFWRSRYPVGPTPFPVFRVGYADHSSWDMVWLRIDYNGSGFDAFVTDIGLSRTRVSHYMDVFPKPDQWTHIALSWDETEGINFYINGELVGKQSVSGTLYDAGLDQFGPHSRVISPYQVQSDYNFVRGGDIDEVRIYDRMLSDDNIKQLYHHQTPQHIPASTRDLANRTWRDEWWTQNGWNLPNPPPQLLTSVNTTVRKVEIHDAVDIKKWMWKATDGIRETTWPGVYNMSRLPGRYDYFVLPDWDTYSLSGQSIKFTLPQEPWNHVEIWGKAWGQLTYENAQLPDTTFAVRKQGQIKSYHDIGKTRQGGTLRFDNALKEEPIGELSVYNVHEGKAPEGRVTESFTLMPAPEKPDNKALADVAAFINGRYPADEHEKMVGVANGTAPPAAGPVPEGSWPFIHLLIPYGNHPDDGLDGVEIQLPALAVKPTHNGLFPMNIRVKDPLWQMRDLADFSFSVKPNEGYTLWIDTRDRVLPEGRALYISLAGAGADLTPALLKGAKVRLIYKSKQEATAEHETDRFTQVRDLFGSIVEEKPSSPRLNLANRFNADLNDLFKVNPNNWLGKAYKYASTNNIADRPDYKVPEAPAGVPKWAFLQVEYLRRIANVINYYIDNRQIANGEFGGGLSDDDDFTNMFPGTALMGIEPEKTLKSLRLMMAGFYNPDRDPYNAPLRQPSLPLFTNGISTIQADLLHAYEDGVEAVGQLQLLDYGNPTYINKGMAVGKQMLERVTQINPAGHRHFRSRYYSGTTMATEDPWQWAASHSYNLLHTSYLLSLYNGNPKLQKMLVEIADGLLAHAKNGNIYPEINFSTDEVRGGSGSQSVWQVFKAAYDITGDKKYERYVKRANNNRKWNNDSLSAAYTGRIKDYGAHEYINTVGTVWIDRIVSPDNDIQTDRLGGVALARINNTYPQNYLGWKMEKPANYTSMAFFVSKASAQAINILAYNLEQRTVNTNMSVWNIKPGKWKVIQGLDHNNDGQMDGGTTVKIVNLEPGASLKLSFPARKNTLIRLELVQADVVASNKRTDLGIAPTDVKLTGNQLSIRIYNVSSVDAPPTTLLVKDATGKAIKTVAIPAIKAPLDLLPKWADVMVSLPADAKLSSGSVTLDPEKKLLQITRLNDQVKW